MSETHIPKHAWSRGLLTAATKGGSLT